MRKENFDGDIENALNILQSGGIILYPTDTVWGLGCDATNEAAVEKIYALKQRPGSKALVVLVASEKDILKYISSPDLAVFNYLDSVEKPTTIIYDGAVGLAENLVGVDGSVAIRIVREEFCKTLIKRFRKPIVSTSANVSGHTTPGNFDEISEEIKSSVDYVVQYRQHDGVNATSSAIVKWNKDGSLTNIRE